MISELTLNSYKLRHPDAEEIYKLNTLHESIQLSAKVYYEKEELNSFFLLFVDDIFVPSSIKVEEKVSNIDKKLIAKEIVSYYRNCCDFSELDEELKFGGICEEYPVESCMDCLQFKKGKCLGPMYSNPKSIMDVCFSKEIKEKYNL